MVFPSLATWLYFVEFGGHSAMRLVAGACKVLQFAFPVLWVCAVERRRLRAAWPSGKGAGHGLLFGLFVGVVILALYFGVLKSSSLLAEAPGQLRAKLVAIGVASPSRFLALALFYSLVHSFLEEYYWRWFIFGRVRRGTGMAAAIALSSVAFMAHHVIVIGTFLGPDHFWTSTLFFSVCVAAGGAVWAWLYERSGSLLGPWLSHLLVDAAIMLVGYDLLWGSSL